MSSRLAISAFSRSVSASIASSASRRSTAVRPGDLVEQVRHRRLDRGERASEVVRHGGEQRAAHALGLPVDLGLRRGAQEPVALEHQGELIAERAEDAALGGRERRAGRPSGRRARASALRRTAGVARAAAPAIEGSQVADTDRARRSSDRHLLDQAAHVLGLLDEQRRRLVPERVLHRRAARPRSCLLAGHTGRQLAAELLDRAELGLSCFGGPGTFGGTRQELRDDAPRARGTRTAPRRTPAGRSSNVPYGGRKK